MSKAYFENFAPDAEPGEKVPGWHALIHQLDEAFEPRILQKIEAYVEKWGVGETHKQFKRDWRLVAQGVPPGTA